MKLSKEINLYLIGGMLTLGILFAAISIYAINKNSSTEMAHLNTLIKRERKNKLLESNGIVSYERLQRMEQHLNRRLFKKSTADTFTRWGLG